MKKTMIFLTTLLFSLFISITSVKATTKVSLTEKSNGNINTKLHFDEGFVGGVDVAFKVDGNVSVQSFNFNSKLANKNIKSYNYDSKNKVLNVRITSGGIGTSHNLLNSSKEIDLGNIVLNTSAKSSVSYSLAPTSLKIVDNSWNAQKIDTNNDDKKDFNYSISTLENKPSTDNKVDDSNSSSKSSTSKSNTSSKNNTSSKKTTSQSSNVNSSKTKDDTKTDTVTDNNEVKKDENSEEVLEDEEIINDEVSDNNIKTNDSKTSKDEKQVKEKKKSKNVIPFIIGTGVLAFIGIFVTIKNRY